MPGVLRTLRASRRPRFWFCLGWVAAAAVEAAVRSDWTTVAIAACVGLTIAWTEDRRIVRALTALRDRRTS